MKKLYLPVILILFSQTLTAQSWQWSKKISPPYGRTLLGMFSDRNGTIYAYGSQYHNYYWGNLSISDTAGSFLQKFDANGNLLFSKRWQKPFDIQKMDYDGNNAVYFAAEFKGTLTIDGITVVSKGNADGVIGKMDLNGTILWMNSFGGSAADYLNTLCYNPADGSVYAGGSITDSLYFNNVFTASGQQSAIIVNYNTAGSLIRYKLYDFVPDSDAAYVNSVAEMGHNLQGNIFVLMDREGRGWGEYNGTGIVEGRYVMKLNPALDTLWSTFIINGGCYYGWDCRSLGVSANGDAYITSYCSGHYGGSGTLYRLNGNSGSVTWTYNDVDAGYTNLYIDFKTVYLIGVEGANGCPCESSYPGYEVIKIIDASNNIAGETRNPRANMSQIIKNSNGIFVAGSWYWDGTNVLGPDTLIADSIPDGNSYWHYGSYLSRLSTTLCQPVVTTVTNTRFNYAHSYFACSADSVQITVQDELGTYVWSDNETGPTAHIHQPGGHNYNVINTQPDGCIAYSVPEYVTIFESQPPEVLAVSFDSVSQKNLLAWEWIYPVYDSVYIIHKETSPGNFTAIDTLISNYSTMKYVDSASSPSTRADRYAISTLDRCGNESPLSPLLRTMLLTVHHTNAHNILTWNAAEGFTYSKYYIYRGYSAEHLALVDSINVSALQYTDNTSDPFLFYQVRVRKTGPAYWQLQYMMRSNIATCTSGAADRPEAARQFSINPILGSGIIHIQSTGTAQLSVFSVLSGLLFTRNLSEGSNQVDLSAYGKGLYFLNFSSGNATEVRRVVVN